MGRSFSVVPVSPKLPLLPAPLRGYVLGALPWPKRWGNIMMWQSKKDLKEHIIMTLTQLCEQIRLLYALPPWRYPLQNAINLVNFLNAYLPAQDRTYLLLS